MCSGLGEEERTKITKKKKEKKGNKKKKNMNLIMAKRGLVGMKGYLNTYEIFFAVLKPFLTETAFYAKLEGRFSGPKTEVT